MTATLGTGITAGGRASQLVKHGFSAAWIGEKMERVKQSRRDKERERETSAEREKDDIGSARVLSLRSFLFSSMALFQEQYVD